MNFLRRKFCELSNAFTWRYQEYQEKPREISKYDIYLEYIYRVLSWDDTSFTLTVLLAINFFFWLVLQLQIEALGIICLITLHVFIIDNYLDRKNIEQFEIKYSEEVDELCCICSDIYINLKTLRKENPSSFCILMSLLFFITSLLARSLSGSVMIYLLILGLFFIPLGIKLLPEQYSSYIRKVISDMTRNEVLAEEALFPFLAQKDLNTRDLELESLLTDKTADSITNSLNSGPVVMPSYLDSSDEGVEEDDLVPQSSKNVTVSPGDLSSDSDSDHKEIQFDSSHFNRDSSSEEENRLIEGLKSQISRDLIDTGLKGYLGNIGKLGGVVSSVLSSVSAPSYRKNSSSDSEFEIIDEGDIGEAS